MRVKAKFPVRLYNTLTRSVENFEPQNSKCVSIYCCGPTVYNYQHIGNLRTYVFEDVLVRALRYAGYTVNHVMNITDVGHLVSDADDGEDKMLVAARREGKSSREIADYYTNIFFEHCAWLNIKKPDVVCKATEHVSQMIELIKRIEAKGFAYQSGGNVYFDVSKFERYGDLARLDIENLQSGARIEVDDKKRSPLDFALWFTKSKFEGQELQWDSPWGRGYPGWHIECSAMSMEYLGESFDIHCGGIDHIPVHHTNEIAQSEAATGKQFARWWVHGGWLLTDKDKMSKSTGEFLTLDKIKERQFDPIAYRLFCLSGHYRSELNWSWDAIQGAHNRLKKLRSSVVSWREACANKAADKLSASAEIHRDAFCQAILNDLNAPQALAVVSQVDADNKINAAEKLALLTDFDQIIGLGVESWQSCSVDVPSAVLELAKERDQARAAKDWSKADELRDKITKHGFTAIDTKEGTKIKPLDEA